MVERNLRSANGTEEKPFFREGTRRGAKNTFFVQDRPLGGAGRIGRVYEGTHKGCPYGCWGRGAKYAFLCPG